MAFLPNLTPLVSKINEFTFQQNANQQQIISLLRETNLALSRIEALLIDMKEKELKENYA